MATQLATTENQHHPLVVLRRELEQRAEEFKMVLPSHISPEKLQRTILTAVQANPDLLNCDRRSFLTASFKAAQDGLLPDGREAALVQFNSRQKIDGQWQTVKLAQYLPMVFGLRKKILQSGEIADIFANVVYRQEVEAKHFVYEEGTERQLRHKPLWLTEPDFDPNDDDIIAAYSIATFKDGSQSFEVMRRSEINKVRETSQTGATKDRQGQPREPKGPWVDWFAEMAKKTVLRRHSKSLPMSGDVFADVEAEDMDAAARSSVALLDSRKPDAPMIEETPHDLETGEIEEESAEASVDKTEGNSAPVADAAAQPETDNDHPAAQAAQSWIALFDKCETIIDLKGQYSRSEPDRGVMDDGLREAVEKSYDENTARLNRQFEKAKTEQAKADAEVGE